MTNRRRGPWHRLLIWLSARRDPWFAIRRGRGIAPHWNDKRVPWLVAGPLGFQFDIRYWQIGLGFRPWVLRINLGPLTILGGRQRFRWRVFPTTTTSVSYEAFQDHCVTFTTGSSTGPP